MLFVGRNRGGVDSKQPKKKMGAKKRVRVLKEIVTRKKYAS